MTTLTLSAAAAPRSRPGATAVRLTRRGRLAVFAALLATLLTVLVAWGPGVVATSEAGEPVPVRTVVVQPGETLWDIATAADPGGNTGQMVQRIAELNSLPSTGRLQIGQQIAVPLD